MGAVIFDLDGVLVESEPYWRAALAEAVNAYAREVRWQSPSLSAQDMTVYLGGRVDESLRSILDGIGQRQAAADPSTVDALTSRVIGQASESFVRRPLAIETSVRAARELHARGTKLAVASSSAPAFIDTALRAVGLEEVFAARQSALGLERGKPDPEVYRLVVDQLGERPGDCLAIEDSPKGIGSAVAAGLRCIGLWREAGPAPTAFDDCVWTTSALDAGRIEAELRRAA